MSIDLSETIDMIEQARGFALDFDPRQTTEDLLGAIGAPFPGVFAGANALALGALVDNLKVGELLGVQSIIEGIMASVGPIIDPAAWGFDVVEHLGIGTTQSLAALAPHLDFGGVAPWVDALSGLNLPTIEPGVLGLVEASWRGTEGLTGLAGRPRVEELAQAQAAAFDVAVPVRDGAEADASAEPPACVAAAPELPVDQELELAGDVSSVISFAEGVRRIRLQALPLLLFLSVVMGVLVLQAASRRLDIDAVLLALSIGVSAYLWASRTIATGEASE